MGVAQPSNHQWPEVKLGHPSISGPLTVFPILGDNGGHDDYMLLADAVQTGAAKVRETNAQGHIPVIEIHNRGTAPVLGLQGEEYAGAKQNRSLNISVLAGPGKTRIPVTCVESGRWDHGPVAFSTGSYETMGLRAMKMAGIHVSSKTIGDRLRKFFSDQGKVWDSVRGSSDRHGVSSPTMAMFDIYSSKDVAKNLDEITSGIELPNPTCGVVISIGGRVVACDMFEDSRVFSRIRSRLLRSYALSAIGTEGRPPSVEAAESFIGKPRGETPSATSSVGLGDDVRWEAADFLCTALVWQDRYLHATMFARDVA